MNRDADPPEAGADARFPFVSIAVTVASVAALGVFWWLSTSRQSDLWTVAFLLAQVVVISIVIWQACDPFADAAQWIGRVFRLPGSVRGATLDAVASSMPELFSGIFFVVVAMVGVGDSPAEMAAAGSDGYGATVATCAGSAVYNMILIPAFCAIFISFYRPKRPTIDVDSEVISRDGVWFLGCSAVLLVFLFQDSMHWWMAVVFILLYVVYVGQLYRDAKVYKRAQDAIRLHFDKVEPETTTQAVVEALRAENIRATPLLVDEIRRTMLDDSRGDEAQKDQDETAGVLFGLFDVRLNHTTVWLVILLATAVAAVACYWLVRVTNDTANVLGIPAFFVAVILAAAASSVPDTFLSVMAAKRGDDSGAVSNAFGSNIFDICICLSIPLLIHGAMTGWQPVYLTADGTASGQTIAGLNGLRVMLLLLTVVTLLIMWHNRQLTRNKAWVLCGLYVAFIAYAVVGAWYEVG